MVNCDWGTTHFRLRAVRLDGCEVAAQFRSADGVARLAEGGAPADRGGRYRAILADGMRQLCTELGDSFSDAPVLVSGMAGSSIGWREIPYAGLPFALDGSQLAWRELDALRSELGMHRVVLISGVASASDVMRGEETELVGLFTLPVAERLAGQSLVIKPGTHSKHVRVQSGRMVAFQTFMTGELYDLLGRHSVLRHSIGPEAEEELSTAEALAELRAGVRHAGSVPLGAALFRVRTRQLLDNLEGTRNRSFLSGVLLGGELAYLLEAPFEGLPLLLCATTPLQAPYRAALEELGLDRQLSVIPAQDVERLSARGQAVLWRRMGGI